MSNNFTPGPWVRHPSSSEKWSQIIRPENGKWPYDNVAYIAEMHEDECTKKGAHNANARLIAASPELLEALEMVRDADNDCIRDGLPTIPGAARAKIDAAIRKATGEAP